MDEDDVGAAEGSAGMRIGLVSRRAGVRASSIRYYESIGLLPEPKREGLQRRYGPEVLRLIAVIGAAQRAGLSLVEIRKLLTASRSSHRRAVPPEDAPEPSSVVAAASPGSVEAPRASG